MGATQRSFFLYALAICLAWISLAGCRLDKVEELETYSRHIQRQARPWISRYAQAYARVADETERKGLRDLIGKQILPPLEQAVHELQAIRPTSPALLRIHQQLTTQYKQWAQTLRQFKLQATSEAKWVTLAKGLQTGAKQMQQAERSYHKAIKQYTLEQSKAR